MGTKIALFSSFRLLAAHLLQHTAKLCGSQFQRHRNDLEWKEKRGKRSKKKIKIAAHGVQPCSGGGLLEISGNAFVFSSHA
jgi:hypothetical protein